MLCAELTDLRREGVLRDDQRPHALLRSSSQSDLIEGRSRRRVGRQQLDLELTCALLGLGKPHQQAARSPSKLRFALPKSLYACIRRVRDPRAKLVDGEKCLGVHGIGTKGSFYRAL